jgi:pimeloyl-ACP methyl ester carboxylesterase
MSLRRTQYSVTRGTGRYGLTSEIDITWEPRIVIANAPVVVLLHGLLGSADSFQDSADQATYPKLLLMGPLMASYGCKVIAIDGGSRAAPSGPDNTFTHWGNPSHTARLETLRTNLGVAKLSFIGVSMGNYAALQYAVNHLANIGALVGYSGACDIVAFYNSNGQPGYLSDAWGVGGGASLPAAADIVNHVNLVGIPWLNYHCNDDATIPVATATAMATHIGSSARLTTFTTGGHAGTIQQADFEQVVSWLWDYGS